MINLSELLLNLLANAVWQIVAITLAATICARLLQNAPARYRHWIWVAALLLSVALPVWSVIPKMESQQQTTERIIQQALLRPRQTSPERSSAPPQTAPATSSELSLPANNVLKTRRFDFFTDARVFLFLSSIYLLFVLYRAVRLTFLWRRTQTLKQAAYKRDVPELMQAVARQCFSELGLNKVTMLCSSSTSTPGIVGGRHPVIILPESFFENLSGETLYSILGHEMAHVARRDFQLNLLYEFLLLPISFHPLSRYIKQQIDRTRELACDEMVTDKLLAPMIHARSLVSIAGALLAPAERALTLGIFDANILEERIMKLTQKTRRFGLRGARLLTGSAFLLLCVLTMGISSFSFELHANQKSLPVSPVQLGPAQTTPGGTVLLNQQQPDQPTRTAQPGRAEVGQKPASAAAQESAQFACDAGKQHSLESIPALIEMLGDDRQTELIKCWTNGRWSPALDSFKQPSPGEQAAIALASMGSPALEPLTLALSSQNASVRRNAAWAIGELTNMGPNERSEAVMPLITLLGDSDAWVRMAAAQALGEVRDERASERLIAALLDGNQGVRKISAWALGEMKDDRAVQTLCTVVVSDAQTDVRLAAAEALGEIRNKKAVPSLKQALNDSEIRVRTKASWALEEILDNDG